MSNSEASTRAALLFEILAFIFKGNHDIATAVATVIAFSFVAMSLYYSLKER